MHLPRRLRQSADFEDLGLDEDADDTETFRELLLDALAKDPEVQAVIRRLTAVPKTPEPRASRRR